MSWMQFRSTEFVLSRRNLQGSPIWVLPLIGILVMASVASAFTTPPDDREIERISGAYETFVSANAEAADFEQKEAAYCATLLEDYDLEELSAGQLQGLFAVLLKCPERHEALHDRLTALASSPTTDGVIAACLDFGLAIAGEESDETNRALRRVLVHRAMPAALGEGNEIAEAFLDSFDRLGSQVLSGAGAEMVAFGRSLPDQMPGSILPGTLFYYLALLRAPDGEVDVAESEPIRRHLVGLFTQETDVATRAERGDAWYFKSRVAMLNGAFARRALMNQAAPPMEIQWSSNSALAPSLENLRGKVVVLDYWAIWCAPCIAKFPEVRDLQSRYAGYEVEIIGMTSAQGYHFDPEKGRIDCSNDPEKEFGLMSGYMSQKDMTWTVAYSRESAFNNDYGVVSLPHMAILDTEGRVRFNNIPVSTSSEEIASMIDTLLREADRRVPED